MVLHPRNRHPDRPLTTRGRVLVIGASRGIGLGLVDRHLADGWEVHATTRDGAAPRSHTRLRAHRLDVRRQPELEAIITVIDRPLDRIVHNAGIKGGSRAAMMEVNAESPIRVTERLLEAGLVGEGGTIALMTSQMGARRERSGSLGDYGDSKAALNDEFRRRAEDWRRRGGIAVVMHPGWVRTDMGGSSAAVSVRESADGITDVLDALDPADHGKFLTWQGREHPW